MGNVSYPHIQLVSRYHVTTNLYCYTTSLLVCPYVFDSFVWLFVTISHSCTNRTNPIWSPPCRPAAIFPWYFALTFATWWPYPPTPVLLCGTAVMFIYVNSSPLDEKKYSQQKLSFCFVTQELFLYILSYLLIVYCYFTVILILICTW